MISSRIMLVPQSRIRPPSTSFDFPQGIEPNTCFSQSDPNCWLLAFLLTRYSRSIIDQPSSARGAIAKRWWRRMPEVRCGWCPRTAPLIIDIKRCSGTRSLHLCRCKAPPKPTKLHDPAELLAQQAKSVLALLAPKDVTETRLWVGRVS